MTVAWRSRIVGEADVPPDTLTANPANHRRHSARQKKAISAVLDDLGWVSRVIVNRRTGRIVDGHARVAMAIDRKQPTVPVVYVDLDDAEERRALATYDAIGALATSDPEAWKAHIQAMPEAAKVLARLTPWSAPIATGPDVRLLPIASHLGAYALHGRARVDPDALLAWKAGAHPEISDAMVTDFVTAWRARRNHIDIVTMPPPSRARARDYGTHAMWDIVIRVADAISVPAVPLWAPREAFAGRGRGRSKVQIAPLTWLPDAPPDDVRSALVLDDVVTTRATHTQARDALNQRGIAAFFLAWVSYGH